MADCSDPETSFDVQSVISVVPNIDRVIIYVCYNLGTDCLLQAGYDNIVSSMSTSYSPAGSGAALNDQYNSEAAVLAAQGITFFTASGDDGCTDIFYPADMPFATSVAGTCLGGGWSSGTVTSTYPGESSWTSPGTGQYGSGAGSSTHFSMPSWQVAAVTQFNAYQAQTGATQLSMSYRAYPDVAALGCWPGQPNMAVYYPNGGSYGVCETSGPTASYYGTSFAAPMWNGLAALINEYLASQGLGRLGFLNPIVYAIGANPADYAAAFRDVDDGGYTACDSTTFHSQPGYDVTSGWGSPDFAQLAPIVAAYIANNNSLC